ncbi:MAG: arginine repressor [Clostridia bacterium]|nr:arginine repressor [Clostridia bacterium]
MKDARQAAILEIIRQYPIATQDELIEKLRVRGCAATQATISRDIKSLRLVKALDPNGVYRYMTAQPHNVPSVTKFERVFSDSVQAVDCACNIVVCKCIGGMAQAACAAIDTKSWNGLVGTLAGEDTFLCIMRQPEQAEELVDQLRRLLHR